jgi:hypothetical protein
MHNWIKTGGGRGYYTTQEFHWYLGKDNFGVPIVIPVGREFESSVPPLLGWIISPDDPKFLRAALVHDFLLESGHGAWTSAGEWYRLTILDGANKRHALICGLAITIVTVIKRWK